MLSNEDTQEITQNFLAGSFYNSLLAPYINQQKEQLVIDVRKLISQDSPKNKFAIISGKLAALEDLEDQLEMWRKKVLPKSSGE